MGFAIHWSFVDTVGELKVSPVFPPSGTSCPASPSLPWVPWVSVPHVHRYYARLRLPTVHPGRFARRSLPGTLLFPLVCIPSEGSLTDGETHGQRRDFWSAGSPRYRQFVTGKQWALPSSRVTPVSTCPALRPRWCPLLACHIARKDCCLPLAAIASAFPPLGWGGYPYRPRLYIFRGSIPRPALSLHPAPYTPLPERTRVRYGPAGSALVRSDLPYCYHAGAPTG